MNRNIMMNHRVGLATVFFILLATVQPYAYGQADICYAYADSGNSLVRIDDIQTTPSVTVLGGSGASNIEAIVLSLDSTTLYAANANTFGTLDLNTGAYTSIGSFGTAGGSAGDIALTDVDGLAIDPATGVFYGTHRRDTSGDSPPDILFRINPTTGAHIPNAFGSGVDYVVIPGTAGLEDIDDIAIDETGQMYGVANDGGSGDLLVEINKATGAATNVGIFDENPGAGTDGVDDMEGFSTFNDGVLYGTTGSNGNTNAEENVLWEIDETTGDVTLVISLAVGGLSDYEAVACLTGGVNTITGTVFEDTNDSGSQNGGELGTSGVTVRLYIDENNDGQVDGGDTLIQTTVTDTNGDYSFQVAIEGNFVVDVDTNTLPTGAQFTPTGSPVVVQEANFVGFNNTDINNDFGYLLLPELNITKTSSANGGPVQTGDVITYTIEVENTGVVDVTDVVVSDVLPTGVAYVTESTVATSSTLGSYLDEFTQRTYSNSHGLTSWTSSWVEVEDGAAGPTSGEIRVTNNGELRLQDLDNGESITRAVDLSIADASQPVTLTWSWERVNGNEAVRAQLLVGGSWIEVDSTGTSDGSGTESHTLTAAQVAGTTSIRFVTDSNNWNGNDERIDIDNVQFSFTTLDTLDNAPGGANDLDMGTPPSLVTANDGFQLAPGETLIVTFDVTVDDPLSLAITELTNTASTTSDQTPTPVSDSAMDQVIHVDYGDAPITYGDASHGILPTLFLGSTLPDSDAGARGSDSLADDNNNNDDEDGVLSFPSTSTADGVYTVNVDVTTNSSATLCGWIDFDQNGTFEADEGQCQSGITATGTQALAFTVPVDDRDNSGTFFARFRVSTDSLTTADMNGFATDGEVEDYETTNISTLPISLSSVHSQPQADGLEVTWTTATETQNVGFNLYGRLWGDDEWQQLNPELIPSKVLDSLSPQSYKTFLLGMQVDELLLEDVDTRNQRQRHGPFAVGKHYGVNAFEAAQPIDWQAIHASNYRSVVRSQSEARSQHALNGGVQEALLWVEDEGIQRLSFEVLQATGVDFSGVASHDLALLDQGKAQFRHIEDDDGVFGPGDYIEFVGTIEPTLYSRRNAYTLKLDPGKVKVAKSQIVDDAGETHAFAFEQRFEQQNRYSFGAPVSDPWYDARLLARPSTPAQASRSFSLPGYAGGNATLTLNVWGITDWPGQNPDHHLQIKLNGELLDERWYDGLEALSLDFNLPESVLQSADNTLEVIVVGDTGFDWDIQTLDNFSIVYQRLSQAHDGAWQGTLPSKLTVRVDNLQGEAVAWKGRQRRTGTEALKLKGQGTWHVADSRAIHSPAIQVGIPNATLKAQTDYLIVSHPLFADQLSPLEALQQSRGLDTAVVTTDVIYAAYSDHETSAEAIRTFIKKSRPEYILLVGGDSVDYHGYLNNGNQSLVPTHYVRTDDIVSFAPSDAVHADRNNDGIPDKAIGRLPARSVGELQILLSKLDRYQPVNHTLLSSGTSDQGRTFSLVNEGFEAMLPLSWTYTTANADDTGLAAAKNTLLSELNLGDSLISYHGHSSSSIWGSFNPGFLLTANEARQLSNQTPTIVAQWGCWNTYFTNPTIDTMANAFLFNPTGGAVAVLGATTLTELDFLAGLGERFFAALDREDTLGQALLRAQRQMARDNPETIDALGGFVLLGDPATPLQ